MKSLDSEIQKLALRHKAESESGNQTSFVASLNNEHLVEMRGIEPRSDDRTLSLLRA